MGGILRCLLYLIRAISIWCEYVVGLACGAGVGSSPSLSRLRVHLGFERGLSGWMPDIQRTVCMRWIGAFALSTRDCSQSLLP